MLLSNTVAIITGGARGMGRGIAIKFAEEGCSSVIADVLEAEAKKTVAEVTKRGREAVFVRCDVRDSRQIQNVVDQTINKFGKIDILVCCAGVGAHPTSIEDISEEEWDRVLDINLKGIFLFCKAVVPHMKERRSGKIINVVSLAARSPGNALIHYAASKGGAATFTVGLALEMAPFNVRVNAIHPGVVRTDMVADLAPVGVTDIDAFLKVLAKIVPMQRVGTPEDIASAALFLASDLSSYVTGDELVVGGGMPWSMPSEMVEKK